MTQDIRETTITCLTDYVSILDKVKGPEPFFRGQGKDWILLPKVARDSRLKGQAIIELEKTIFEEFKRRARPFFQFEPEIRDDIELLTIG